MSEAENINHNVFPLTYEQERLWWFDRMHPGSTSNNIFLSLRFEESIDIQVLERCFNQIIQRHHALRTVFMFHDNIPLQRVIPTLKMEISTFDIRDADPSDDIKLIKQISHDLSRKVFDLSEAPLFRVVLCQLPSKKSLLLFVCHHIIFDAWSWQIILRELMVLYEAYVAGQRYVLPPVIFQYHDYAAFERDMFLEDASLQKRLKFWQKQIEELPKPLFGALKHNEPSVSLSYENYFFEISNSIMQSLRQFCGNYRASFFVTLVAIVKLCLFSLTQQDDILVGVPHWNRPREDLRKFVGYMASPVVLRTKINPAVTFLEFLKDVTGRAYRCFEFHMPLGLVCDVKKPYNQIFQVMCDYVSQSLTVPENTQVIASTPEYGVTGALGVDLGFAFLEQKERFLVAIAYNVDIFDKSTTIRLSMALQDLMRSIIDNPTARLNTLIEGLGLESLFLSSR